MRCLQFCGNLKLLSWYQVPLEEPRPLPSYRITLKTVPPRVSPSPQFSQHLKNPPLLKQSKLQAKTFNRTKPLHEDISII